MIQQTQQMLNHVVLVLRIVRKSEMIKISQLLIWYHCQTEISDCSLRHFANIISDTVP